MLGMFGALTYSMVNLTTQLLTYPVSVDLSITSEQQLTFPAVTVCNMSPVKKSSLAISTAVSSSRKRRKKRATSGGRFIGEN
jgi:hypothetical protein